jgi:hypothetical protein
MTWASVSIAAINIMTVSDFAGFVELANQVNNCWLG